MIDDFIQQIISKYPVKKVTTTHDFLSKGDIDFLPKRGYLMI